VSYKLVCQWASPAREKLPGTPTSTGNSRPVANGDGESLRVDVPSGIEESPPSGP